MTQPSQETILVCSDAGSNCVIDLSFDLASMNRAVVTATYVSGTFGVPAGTRVASWPATYEPPGEYWDGQVAIGDGRIDLEVAALRRIGLGSLLMRPLVRWILNFEPVPVVPITLAGDDARTATTKNIRNRFYEKLGFVFDYQDDGLWGESTPLKSGELVLPELRLAEGWKLKSTRGAGQVL